jgi:hypothetical protein
MMEWIVSKPKYQLGQTVLFIRVDEDGNESGREKVIITGVRLDTYTLPDVYWDYYIVLLEHTQDHLPLPYYLDTEISESRLVEIEKEDI